MGRKRGASSQKYRVKAPVGAAAPNGADMPRCGSVCHPGRRLKKTSIKAWLQSCESLNERDLKQLPRTAEEHVASIFAHAPVDHTAALGGFPARGHLGSTSQHQEVPAAVWRFEAWRPALGGQGRQAASRPSKERCDRTFHGPRACYGTKKQAEEDPRTAPKLIPISTGPPACAPFC